MATSSPFILRDKVEQFVAELATQRKEDN